MFRDYFDAEVVAVQRAVLMVLRSQERRVAAKVMNTDTFENAAAAKAWNKPRRRRSPSDVEKAK